MLFLSQKTNRTGATDKDTARDRPLQRVLRQFGQGNLDLLWRFCRLCGKSRFRAHPTHQRSGLFDPLYLSWI